MQGKAMLWKKTAFTTLACIVHLVKVHVYSVGLYTIVVTYFEENKTLCEQVLRSSAFNVICNGYLYARLRILFRK